MASDEVVLHFGIWLFDQSDPVLRECGLAPYDLFGIRENQSEEEQSYLVHGKQLKTTVNWQATLISYTMASPANRAPMWKVSAYRFLTSLENR